MTESLIDESDITIDDNTEILGTRRIIILCDSEKIANKQVKEILENAEIVERLKARMKIIEELPDSHDILNDMYVETKYLSSIWLELSKLLESKK